MRRCGRRAALVIALGAALLLGACTLVPRAVTAPGDTLVGRMAVRVDGVADNPPRAVSASFELQGSGDAGTLSLSTPLGSVLAQARWSPGSVALVTPQGESRFPDLDALTREVLGEPLPVAALFDWLRGRPWPGAPSQASTAPAKAGFEQLGWVIDLERFNDAWVTARRDRAPVVTVRAKLDTP